MSFIDILGNINLLFTCLKAWDDIIDGRIGKGFLAKWIKRWWTTRFSCKILTGDVLIQHSLNDIQITFTQIDGSGIEKIGASIIEAYLDSNPDEKIQLNKK